MKRVKLIFLMIFVLLSTLLILIFEYKKSSAINEILVLQTKKVEKSYKAIYDSYQKRSDRLINQHVKQKKVFDLLYKLSSANKNEKENIKKELGKFFVKKSKNFKKILHVTQFQFYLPNNEIFLNLNENYNPTFVSDSINYVNSYKSHIHGFEIGSLGSEFVYVYPIIYKTKHIATVSISYDSLEFLENAIKNYSVIANILIRDEILAQKVFKNQKNYYTKSPINGYSYDTKAFKNTFKLKKIKKLKNSKIKNTLIKTILEVKNISLYNKNNENIVTKIPLKSINTGEVVGIYISREKANNILNLLHHITMLEYFMVTLMGFIVIIFYIRYALNLKLKRESARMHAVFNAQAIITVVVDNQKIVKANHSFFKFFDFIDMTNEKFQTYEICICDFFEPIDKEGYITIENQKDRLWLDKLLSHKNNLDKVCIKKDNVLHHFAISAERIDERSFVVSLMNITKEISINENIKNIINFQNNMLIILDSKLNLSYANKKFLDNFKVESTDDFKAIHKDINKIFVGHKDYFTSNSPNDWINEIANLDEAQRIVSIVNEKDYSINAYLVSLSYVKDSSTWICFFTEYTQLAIEKQTLSKKAFNDELTGLPNRTRFNENIKKALHYYNNYDADFCLAIFDIDFFKRVNDTYGHHAGDVILKELAILVNKSIRDRDLFARWGGEEFALLFYQTDIQNAYKAVEHIRKSIEDYIFYENIHITCSFGLTQIIENDTEKLLFDRSDTALYEAKNNGRNCIEISLERKI